MRNQPIYGIHPDTTDRRSVALYRLYTHDLDLAYVGISSDPQRRIYEHERTQFWWQYIETRLTPWEWFSDRVTAAEAERQAIWREFPAFNRAHNYDNLDSLEYGPPTLCHAIRPGLPPEDGAAYWSLANHNGGWLGRACSGCHRLITTRPGVAIDNDQWWIVQRCPRCDTLPSAVPGDRRTLTVEEFVWWLGRRGWYETWTLENPGQDYHLSNPYEPAWA